MEGEPSAEAGDATDEVVRRRPGWPVVVAAVLVAVIAVAWWGRFRWLPGYRPALEAGERYCVGVSSHQGAGDWDVGEDFEGLYRIRDELDRPIWHRRVLIRPDVAGWWIWQVHGYASVDGIDRDADLDVMRGDHPSDVPAGPGT